MPKVISLSLFPVLLLISCSDLEPEGAQLISEVSDNQPKAEQIVAKGELQESEGDIRAAARNFDNLSRKYPMYKDAAEYNFRAGNLWEKASEPEKAFESYQNYIKTFRNGINYQSALNKQSDIAFSAAKGGLSKKFLGMTQDPQYDEVVEMLSSVRDNAPASDLAARAQFAIGTYSESKEKTNEAVAAFFSVADNYPEHSLAPEATLRAGKLLSGVTISGNQNSSNIDRARQTLEDLIQQYPGSTQAQEARSLLSEVSGTDLQRTFNVASFYEERGKVSSAKFYYEEVVEKASPDSELYQKAQEKINAL